MSEDKVKFLAPKRLEEIKLHAEKYQGLNLLSTDWDGVANRENYLINKLTESCELLNETIRAYEELGEDFGKLLVDNSTMMVAEIKFHADVKERLERLENVKAG